MADYSALYRIAPIDVSAPRADFFTPLSAIANRIQQGRQFEQQQAQRAAEQQAEQEYRKASLAQQGASATALEKYRNAELGLRKQAEDRLAAAANKPELVDVYGPTGIRTTMQRSSSGEVTPIPGQAAAPQGTQSSDLTGQDFLNTLEPGRANLIKGIADGRYPPPTTAALRSPQTQQILQDLGQYEPGFDLTAWKSRNQTRSDFSSGKMGSNIRSFNTVIGHLGDLLDAGEKLNNTSYPTVNKIANAYITNKGDPRVTNFELKRQAVADELAKAFRETGMSESEIQAWKGRFDAAFSPDQLKGAVGSAVGLLNSRINAVTDQYTKVMGKPPSDVLSSSAKKTLQKIGIEPVDSTTSPQQNQPAQPQQDQQNPLPETRPSNQYAQYQEGDTAINKSTGQRLVYRSGKWQPM